MLKFVRISSFVCMVLVLGVIIVLTLSILKGDPEANAFLQKQSIFEATGNSIENITSQDDENSPLVVQAQLFALRIDPPKVDRETIPIIEKKVVDRGIKRSIPVIPDKRIDPPHLRFDLLATVRYESAPEKSLALFQYGSKQEWFRCGDTVDRYRIREIKDGRVVITQPNRKSKEMYVPPKSPIASLLKNG